MLFKDIIFNSVKILKVILNFYNIKLNDPFQNFSFSID